MSLRPCVIDDCEGVTGKPGTAKGMCHAHYHRLKRYGDPQVVRRRRNTCEVDGCDLFVKSNGWCDKHYTRWVRYGSPTYRMPGEIVDGHRICAACGIDKPLSEWGAHRGTKTGISAYCKRCTALRQKANRARPEYVRSPRDPAKDRELARRWRIENPDKVRSTSAAYRARKVAATVEEFSVQEIFERDGWVCHICETAIDPKAEYPDTASASLDHVVPLSRGGAHSRENCAAAHLFCNISKKDRMGVGRGASDRGSRPSGRSIGVRQ